MDFTSQYCQQRNQLERRAWTLVSKLHAFTDKLLMLVGKDHAEFMAIKVSCVETRQEIIDARDRLTAHRAAHGC